MKLHSYSKSEAFVRLMLLIATLVHYPGVGEAKGTEAGSIQHDAMQSVLDQMQQVARDLNFGISDYSIHTLRKDLKVLRQYGILDRRMYRWGYYLGTGALTQAELSVVLQALVAQAQGDPILKQVYATLERRLRGLNLELDGRLLYPVRTQIQRSIIYLDPSEMMQHGHYRHSLADHIDQVQTAILRGLPIELHQRSNPYMREEQGKRLQVYALQLVYAEIAWYVLCEHLENGHYAIVRFDRLSDHFQVLKLKERGIEAQFQSLQIAHQLLTRGWGLHLGDVEAQQQERLGQLELTTVVVRFFPPVLDFILEGERRHPTQKVRQSKQGGYVDYQVTLPERSLNEFLHWVNRFMNAAKIISPESLKQRHYEAATRLVQRYKTHL